jgi:putative PEP-CTERM system histidine kinase
MALGGYAVRLFGGVWGPTAQIIFVAVAVALLAAAVTSATLRNRARVFLLKHFYRHKYDYREEWLRFIATLSESSETDAPQMAAARAMAQIISSPAAVLLRCRSRGRPMDVIAAWPADNADVTRAAQLGAIAPLVRLLAEREWVVDLDEHRGGEAPEGELPLPAWLLRGEWRLIVPVMLRRELFGLLLLAQPGKGFRLTYEDRDLLKTAARHVATHLAQHEAEQRVAEGQQFEAYSKLTAFMMHDLKNTVAQLQLVVDNARSHRHNPEFVDDAFDTVRNAADRIGRLIEQLQRGVAEGRRRRIDLGAAVRRAAELCADRAPRPTVARLPPQLEVVADRERLTDVIQHVIRNAQEATPQDGSVRIALSSGDGQAVVEVSDTGAGMTPEFVRDGLFRPFHSTKGAKGMGVGAYQAREYLRSLGGDVEVRSQPGRGTDFRLILPIADTTEPDRGHDA